MGRGEEERVRTRPFHCDRLLALLCRTAGAEQKPITHGFTDSKDKPFNRLTIWTRLDCLHYAASLETQVLDRRSSIMRSSLSKLWSDQRGQDIAEYAVMLAVILVLVVGTIRLIGSNANNVFSEAASSIQ